MTENERLKAELNIKKDIDCKLEKECSKLELKICKMYDEMKDDSKGHRRRCDNTEKELALLKLVDEYEAKIRELEKRSIYEEIRERASKCSVERLEDKVEGKASNCDVRLLKEELEEKAPKCRTARAIERLECKKLNKRTARPKHWVIDECCDCDCDSENDEDFEERGEHRKKGRK